MGDAGTSWVNPQRPLEPDCSETDVKVVKSAPSTSNLSFLVRSLGRSLPSVFLESFINKFAYMYDVISYSIFFAFTKYFMVWIEILYMFYSEFMGLLLLKIS